MGVVAAAVTRALALERGNPKPLKEVSSKVAVDKKELIRLQEDSTLRKFKEAKGTEARKGYRVSHEKHGGISFRIGQRKHDVGDTRKQNLLPKSLRA